MQIFISLMECFVDRLKKSHSRSKVFFLILPWFYDVQHVNRNERGYRLWALLPVAVVMVEKRRDKLKPPPVSVERSKLSKKYFRTNANEPFLRRRLPDCLTPFLPICFIKWICILDASRAGTEPPGSWDVCSAPKANSRKSADWSFNSNRFSPLAMETSARPQAGVAAHHKWHAQLSVKPLDDLSSDFQISRFSLSSQWNRRGWLGISHIRSPASILSDAWTRLQSG